jgi:hypothetical protein
LFSNKETQWSGDGFSGHFLIRKEKRREDEIREKRKEMQWSGDGFSGHFLTRKEKSGVR